MRENYELMKKEIGEIKAMCAAHLLDDYTFMNMDGDEFKVLQSALRLVDASMKFTEAQVATMERLEEKLDKLLAKE